MRPHQHRNIGQSEIQGVFEFWNRELELTKKDDKGKRPKLTTDMGRRTFCTFAERLFNFSADDVMAVSHHDDPKSYKGYVVNSSFCDPEKECAINTQTQNVKTSSYNYK